MKRLLRGGWRALKHYCLRPLWRSLASFGSIYVGTEAIQPREPRDSAPRSPGRLVRYTQRRFLELPPGVGGPSPAHPERLREDVPLTEQELLLACEVWPAYERRTRKRG
jgi:hypothetical protein